MTSDTTIRMIDDEMRDTADYLRTLTDEQWDEPSLCTGWRVRDVIGHMASGLDLRLPEVFLGTLRKGGSPDKFSYQVAIDYAEGKSPAELIAAYERSADGLVDQFTTGKKKGIVRLIPVRDGLVDHLIHHEDVRRPFGATRAIDGERLDFCLRATPEISGFMKMKQRVKGLRLTAKDLDVSVGDGPTVEGSAIDLVLAASGRAAGLDGLTGDGVATLQERVKG